MSSLKSSEEGDEGSFGRGVQTEAEVMDVPNLIPSNQAPRTDGADRMKSLGQPPAPNAAAEQAARAAFTGRPPAAAASVRDRVERTPEFEQRLKELKEQLGKEPATKKAELEAMRQEIDDSLQASHETLLRAAMGILHGELFFLGS